MLGWVGLAGQHVLNGDDDITDIEGLQRPSAAFFVVGGGVADLKIMGIGEVTR
jgi:hypothetical protein